MQYRTIGIAGYMGSGKTTFTKMLGSRFGYGIVDGDAEAKRLMLQRDDLKRQLASVFGNDILEQNRLSFKILGKKAFSSQKKVEQLNEIVHPVLLESLRNTIFRSTDECIIVDAALLPLWDVTKWFDRCIWIDASAEIRYHRILRKGVVTDPEELATRMRIQEALFSAPDAAVWTWIANEGDIDTLDKESERFGALYCSR